MRFRMAASSSATAAGIGWLATGAASAVFGESTTVGAALVSPVGSVSAGLPKRRLAGSARYVELYDRYALAALAVGNAFACRDPTATSKVTSLPGMTSTVSACDGANPSSFAPIWYLPGFRCLNT